MIAKLFASAFLIALSILLVSYYFFSPVDKNEKTEQQLIIEKGDGVSQIARKLKEKNLIKNPFFFKIYVSLSGKSSVLQAGNYKLSPSYNISKIVDSLTKGKTEDIKITIIEGLRREEIAEIIGKTLGKKIKEDFLFLSKNKEGYLFPDTYFIKEDTSAEKIIEMMTENFGKKFEEISIKTSLTRNETITLASIVERETKYQEDKAIVSGILYKRLINNWPIEADATVQYAIGYVPSETSWWKKNLTYDDINIESPFNTRKNPGLPPSPICNPGLSSIKEVSNPTVTDYWFYLSDSKGKMHYSKTLEEHEVNIAKYIDK